MPERAGEEALIGEATGNHLKGVLAGGGRRGKFPFRRRETNHGDEVDGRTGQREAQKPRAGEDVSDLLNLVILQKVISQ